MSDRINFEDRVDLGYERPKPFKFFRVYRRSVRRRGNWYPMRHEVGSLLQNADGTWSPDQHLASRCGTFFRLRTMTEAKRHVTHRLCIPFMSSDAKSMLDGELIVPSFPASREYIRAWMTDHGVPEEVEKDFVHSSGDTE